MILSTYSLSIIFILLEVIVFCLIKNKVQRYIGIIVAVVINLFFTNYALGIRLIINLPIIVVGLVFLFKQKQTDKKQKGINTKCESSLGLRIVCFLIPIVGLIVYAVNIVQNPKIAKECGKYALIGFIIGIILIGIITFLILYG